MKIIHDTGRTFMSQEKFAVKGGKMHVHIRQKIHIKGFMNKLLIKESIVGVWITKFFK